MARQQKEIADCEFGFQSGFNGTSAVDDATLTDGSTVMGVDTHALQESVTLVPVGARFTTAGITTVRTVSASNNSQQWTLSNGASSGTFTITLNGETTAGIAYDAAAAAVQSALEALASVAVGDVVVTGTAPWTITLAGALANTSGNTLTVDDTGLTGGTSTLTVIQDGTATWQVTFSPAIVTGSVPSDDDVITWYPERVAYDVFTGNFEWTETDEPEATLSRDKLDGGVRDGVEQPLSLTTAFIFSELRAASGGLVTPYEVLHRIGGAANWLNSSRAKTCSKFCVDLYIIDRAKNCQNVEAEIMIFPCFAKQTVSPGIRGGLVALTGICPVQKPIITRVANNEDAIGVVY